MNLEFWKKPLLASTAVLLLSLLAACGPVFSLHPLYTDKDQVFDPALLGIWIDPTDNSSSPMIFEKGEGSSYKVTTNLSDNSKVESIFVAHLVKLNGHFFLDAVQTRSRVSGQEMDLGLALPAHILARVSFQGNVLRIGLLDEEWIQQEVKAGKISIPHEEVDGDFVLTASTPELQKLVVDYADDDKAFSPMDTFQRKK